MTDVKKYDTDILYKQWNPFYISLQRDIDEVKNLNKTLRSRTTQIDEFFQLINSLFNSTKIYHENEQQKLQTKLDKIESKIYDKKYLTDLKEKRISNQLLIYQHKIIKELEQIFQTMISNFSKKGLIPEITKTEVKPKGRALIG